MENNDDIKNKLFTDIIPRMKAISKRIKEEFKDEPMYVDLNQFTHLKPFQFEGICRMIAPFVVKQV